MCSLRVPSRAHTRSIDAFGVDLHAEPGDSPLACRHKPSEMPPVLDHLGNDFAGRFSDDQMLAGHQGDDGVRILLDGSDEIRIKHERLIVESCDIDHRGLKPFQVSLSAEHQQLLHEFIRGPDHTRRCRVTRRGEDHLRELFTKIDV